ncbi:MAG: thiamine pyrophosphate-dependent dehydrogenase E1 component subunit alpha [Spirochaetales bacterium]|nr:thiamine pyrophosphate-dependent dehydrogenase E1 component subunit alpha [Spirochaetales bacterium]
MALTKDRLKGLYFDMVAIRRFDEEVEKYAKNGTVPGFVHLSIGQEAAQAGIVRALKKTDYKFPDHRGHGAICLCGTERKLVMAEIFGRATGINGGRGGSMHINDLEYRNMGFNGIQGSTVVTCLGTAFSSVYKTTDDVTAVFMGDGTLGEGTCHESMNMAATWKLPIIYCLLNNQYAISTHYTESHPQKQLATWADGYGVPNEVVDGNDIQAVVEATERAAERARKGEGPTLLEFMTYRWQGHFSGDPAAYRPDGELEAWQEKCPLKKCREVLVKKHKCTEAELKKLEDAAEEEIQDAVKFALESPWPDPKNALKYVYSSLQVEDWK